MRRLASAQTVGYEHYSRAYAARDKEVRHYHCQSRQFFLVLSGELTMELEGKLHTLSAHQGIEIPPQAKHQAQNLSPHAVEFVVISHPTTRGDRIDIA